MLLSLVAITICLCVLFGLYVYCDIETERAKNCIESETPRNSVFYNELSREVILNGSIVVATFRTNSLNCQLFEYLNNNKERVIPYDELEKNVLSKRTIQLNKVADQMGFSHGLKKLLFTWSSETIQYHPSKLNTETKIKI